MWVIFPKIVMESSCDIWGSDGFANGNKFYSIFWEVSVIRNDTVICKICHKWHAFLYILDFCIPWRLATRAIQNSIDWIREAKTMGVWTFFFNSHPLHFAVYNKLFFLDIGWPKTNPKHIKIKRYRLLPPYLPHEAWKFNKRTNNLTKHFGGLCWQTHWTKINSMMVT